MSDIGPIPQFLSKISQNWGLTFVYPKIWAVHFEVPSRKNYKGSLVSNIAKVLKLWDNDFNKFAEVINNKNNIYRNLLSGVNGLADSNIHILTGKINHFILATKVSTPNESVYIGSGSNPLQINGGGTIWGHAAGLRENQPARTVDITFLDTYKEFTECIIRPWIIAVAHQGLIESSDDKFPCIKCDIVTDFFAKSSSSDVTKTRGETNSVTYYSPVKTTKKYSSATLEGPHAASPYHRKRIRFHNCVPIKLPEKNYNFAPDIGNDEAMTNITFAYDYYTVEDYGKSAIEQRIVTTEGNIYLDSNGNEISEDELNLDMDFNIVEDKTGFTTNNKLV